MGRIGEETVRAALQNDKGSEAKLMSWRVELLSETDGATSSIFNVTVKFEVAGTEEETCYVVKLSPTREFKDDDFHHLIFTKECRFYTEVMPMVTSILKQLGEQPIRFPKCYYHSLDEGKEILFLENLRVKGFQMRDKSLGLDMAHSCLVLRELGKLHAASYIFQSRSDIELTDKFDFFQTEWTHKFNLGCDWGTFMNSLLEKRLKAFEESEGYERIVKWLKRVLPEVWPLYEKQIERKSPFASIIHGDCWINNMLFRYDASGSPIEVVFLDLQGCRVASVALDLQHFLNLNVKGEIRRPNLDQLLASYYDSLRSTVTAGKTAVPFALDQLKEEYIDKGFYGALYGLLWLPVMCGPEEVDFTLAEYDDNHGIVDRSESDKPHLPTSLISVMEEWTELGLIS
ncbi:uncharacterized protein LOC126987844 [Eriocheir sinensis]|uniref:uncharacterized protein LOC126987844 n=1 Tax=Eriocheir sinensis TaxID=95602 RepID=UPI0021C9FD87|nr:uncharacterized protein LOC126987844 [Eriocheir sinensis]